ncbi:hypothetical protein BCR44DRAFT_1184343 [Catenaria anguillulae PL171]|uniref:Uncharacterized protein n=1 Tax=Catenaria anguillulae PL171 TaxID=765915 RepID=A0A1Y2H590_9FUNG|nr:hypothetical protein BCR44DRAFT_1184343 [Catenaria anguillulae PL171]
MTAHLFLPPLPPRDHVKDNLNAPSSSALAVDSALPPDCPAPRRSFALALLLTAIVFTCCPCVAGLDAVSTNPTHFIEWTSETLLRSAGLPSNTPGLLPLPWRPAPTHSSSNQSSPLPPVMFLVGFIRNPNSFGDSENSTLEIASVDSHSATSAQWIGSVPLSSAAATSKVEWVIVAGSHLVIIETIATPVNSVTVHASLVHLVAAQAVNKHIAVDVTLGGPLSHVSIQVSSPLRSPGLFPIHLAQCFQLQHRWAKISRSCASFT